MDLQELLAAREYLAACLNDMHTRAAGEPLSDDEQRQWDEGRDEIVKIDGLIARHNEVARLGQIPEHTETPTGPEVIRKTDPADVLNDRASTPAQLADAITRSVEPKVDEPENMAHLRSVLNRHLKEDEDSGFETWHWARSLLGRTQPAYVSGFRKYMTGRSDFWSAEERAAMAVGTNTAGGFLVPTHLDPTIVLTNNGTSNSIRPVSRVVTLTEGSVWNGVTSAGATFSSDAELTEVSDDTPAVARVSVPVYKCQGFIQASIESFEDIASLTSDVLMLFADGRDVLEGGLHATGSGSTQATGIFTALDANTNVELTSTTAATIGLADLQTVYRSVPVRWRGRSKWLMNPVYLLAIQALGTALSASYSTNLTEPLTERIIGKPVIESDDAPTTQTTTVRDNEIVFGDFSNYLIVDKPGSTSIEFIPHLFNTSNNLPDGRRGWYMHWRTGADSINDLAFRLLQDKTSA